MGYGLPAPQPVYFGLKRPLLQGDPGIWDSPALPPGSGLTPAPRVRGTQESGPPTARSRRLRNLGPQHPHLRLTSRGSQHPPFRGPRNSDRCTPSSKRPRILVPGAGEPEVDAPDLERPRSPGSAPPRRPCRGPRRNRVPRFGAGDSSGGEGGARGPDGLGEGAAPPPLNNEGACRRGASGGAGGSWGLAGCGKALGTQAAGGWGAANGSRRDRPEASRGLRASAPSRSPRRGREPSAGPWHPVPQPPPPSPGTPRPPAHGFSQPCPSPSAPARAQTFPGSQSLRPQKDQTQLRRLLLSSLFFVSTFPSFAVCSLSLSPSFCRFASVSLICSSPGPLPGFRPHS